MSETQVPMWKGKIAWTIGLFGLIVCGLLLLPLIFGMPEVAILLSLSILFVLFVRIIVRMILRFADDMSETGMERKEIIERLERIERRLDER